MPVFVLASLSLTVWLGRASDASAYLPSDVWAALEPAAATTPPWLARAASCQDPKALGDPQVTPYACMPPVSTTLGFTPDSRGYVSLESDIDPGCGDPVAERMERRKLPGRRVQQTDAVSSAGGSLTEQLVRLWNAADAAVAAGYVPTSSVVLGTALLTSDTTTRTAAVALGPPLADHIVYVDRARKQVSLYTPAGKRMRLASLPATFVRDGTQPSLWEIAIAPDATRMVIRVAALRGTPCDPAALRVFRVKVPVPAPPTPGPGTLFGAGEACATGDDAACERHCQQFPRSCVEGADTVLDRAPPDGDGDEEALKRIANMLWLGCRAGEPAACLGLAQAFRERCRSDGDERSEACRDLGNPLRLRPGIQRRFGKGIVRRPTDFDKDVVRRLRRRCLLDGDACLELAKLYRDGGFRVRPNRSTAGTFARRAIRQLKVRCADNRAACPKLAEAQALLRALNE